MAPRQQANNNKENDGTSGVDMSADEYISSDDEQLQRKKQVKRPVTNNKRSNTTKAKLNGTNTINKSMKASEQYVDNMDDIEHDTQIDSKLLSLDTVVDLSQIPIPCTVEQLQMNRQHNTYQGKPTRMIITHMELYVDYYSIYI